MFKEMFYKTNFRTKFTKCDATLTSWLVKNSKDPDSPMVGTEYSPNSNQELVNHDIVLPTKSRITDNI